MPSGVYTRTEEAKKNIGNATRGRKYPNRKKYIFTEEHKKNLSMSLQGKKKLPRSKEHRENIRLSKLGNKLSVGRILSEETKKKMSDTRKKRKEKLGYLNSPETRKKISKAKRGEKCHLWKGGITPENIKIRNGIEYRLWRESVFARDNWTCQKCEKRGRRINAHHIKNFSKYLEFRTSIENGITLCRECHIKFHKRYGLKHNTLEQLEEFLIK